MGFDKARSKEGIKLHQAPIRIDNAIQSISLYTHGRDHAITSAIARDIESSVGYKTQITL